MGESIQCWQCGTRMTLGELASNDGDCPRCEVEVHLAEYLDNALSKVATLEAENAKLRAELERRAVPDGLPLVIAGALFDFAGFLTTREHVIDIGATCNASPVVDLLNEFAGLRGLSLEDAAVLSWQELLIAAAPSAPKADDPVKVQGDGWIHVNDATPNTAQEVIVFSGFDGVTAGFLDSYDEWYCPNSNYKLTRVSHWMPLPAAPAIAAARKGERG